MFIQAEENAPQTDRSAKRLQRSITSDPSRRLRDIVVSAVLPEHALHANVPGLHGFLEIIIVAQMDFLLGYLDPGTVFFISRIKINAGYAAAVVALQAVVDLVLLMRHDPQVF